MPPRDVGIGQDDIRIGPAPDEQFLFPQRHPARLPTLTPFQVMSVHSLPHDPPWQEISRSTADAAPRRTGLLIDNIRARKLDVSFGPPGTSPASMLRGASRPPEAEPHSHYRHALIPKAFAWTANPRNPSKRRFGVDFWKFLLDMSGSAQGCCTRGLRGCRMASPDRTTRISGSRTG